MGRPAGLGRRTVAAIIDAIVMIVLLVILGKVMGTSSATSSGGHVSGSVSLQGGAALLFFVLAVAYYVGMEGLLGATLGKLALGIRVINSQGSAPGIWAAVVRNLLRVIDVLPFLYIVGLVVALTSPSRQRVGDRVAGTMVVSAN